MNRHALRPVDAEVVRRLHLPRAGEIGERPREWEIEPLDVPASEPLHEPAPEPATPAPKPELEPVPA